MPAKTSRDTAALNELLDTLNNSGIPGWEEPPPGAKELPPAAKELPPAAKSIAPAPVAPKTVERVNKFFFTGKLMSGKDTAANAIGANIVGFADPLYLLATEFLGIGVSATSGKDTPGVREFLQTVGQWGRGVISAQYPLTTGRAMFIRFVREYNWAGRDSGMQVDWESYGRNSNIWLDAALARANIQLESNPGARVAITNCRFDNEFKRLSSEGWQHWHVMCSPKVWKARLAKANLTPESPAIKNISEVLAASIDANVIKQLSAARTGPQLRCIWSDESEPRPSERLHTLESFTKANQ